jgi:hypothetical protein
LAQALQKKGVLPASHSLHFRVHTRVLLTLIVALAVVTITWGQASAGVLLREAAAAQKAGDVTQLIAKLEAARALRPDYPRVLYGLARAYASAGRPADALAELQALATMGLTFSIRQDQALASLRAEPVFAKLEISFADNAAPRGAGAVAFGLPARTGIIEGIARDDRGNWYFGDVHDRCLWRRDAAGQLSRFSAETDHLLGVFGLKIDEAHGALWAGTSAVAEMTGPAEAGAGRAALVEFDLHNGQVRHAYPIPDDGRDHVLGDVLAAPDGGVFATDSLAPIIWRLPAGGKRLQRWLESADFSSLQGLALAADGRSLIVADYANGLWQISLADQSHVLLAPPVGTTLFGIDGIYAVPGGLIAVQNGVSPQRVVRIALAAGGRPLEVRTLAAGHPAMDDISLGCVADGKFHFIGNSGWALFDPPSATPAPRTVSIFQTQI